MFDEIHKPALVQQDLKQQLQQTVNRNGQLYEMQQCIGPLTRKRSRELMQGTDLLQLSSPVPQKKGSFVG